MKASLRQDLELLKKVDVAQFAPLLEGKRVQQTFKVGDLVSKISKKPFKSGKKAQKIVGFSKNPHDPQGRDCAVFDDDSVCNVDILERTNIETAKNLGLI